MTVLGFEPQRLRQLQRRRSADSESGGSLGLYLQSTAGNQAMTSLLTRATPVQRCAPANPGCGCAGEEPGLEGLLQGPGSAGAAGHLLAQGHDDEHAHETPKGG